MFSTCDRNFPPKNVTGPHWWEVNIGSRNALLSLNRKALPELKETQIYHYMASLAFNELDITSSIVWRKFSTPAFRYSLDRFTAYLQMSILPQTDRQGTMDMLFNQASVASPGTYYNMKQVFNHRSLHGNVQNNVQHVWDMIQVQLPVKCITIYHIIHRTWLNYLVMCHTLKRALSPWGYEHPSKKEWHAADSLTSLEHI